jgi:hypothetical protein
MELDDRQTDDSEAAVRRKLPYTPFELIEYGSIEELTQALGPGTKDGLSGSVLL